MENETRTPVPQRTHVHVVLGLIVIPFVAAAVGWIVAIGDVLRGYADRKQLLWTRLLVALVVVDSLVVMGWIWTVANQDEFKEITEAKQGPKSYVGIRFQSGDGADPPVVGTTALGHAGEKAGLRSGDLILEIDLQPVKTQEEAIRLFIAGAPEIARPLKIRRDGEEIDLRIVPSTVPKFELFQIVYTEGTQSWLPDLAKNLPAIVFAVLAWAVGRWRFGARGGVWLGMAICMLGSQSLAVATGRLLEGAMGGLSVGAVLISLTVNASAMLGLGLLVCRLFPPPASPEEPRGTVVKTYFRCVFYLITGVFRIGFLLLMVDVLWFKGLGGSNPIDQLVSVTNLGVTGNLMLIVDTVLLAPLGEELIFRGVLLPHLKAQAGTAWAVGLSAVFFGLLHPHYGVYVPVVVLYGLVLGWARVRSGGLMVPVLLHLSINALATATMLLTSRG